MAVLETERLILRRINLDDKEVLFKMDSDPEVQKYTGDRLIQSVEEIETRIKEISLKDYETYGYGRMAVILKDTNQLIGWSGLKYLPEFDQIDLGYRFMPEHWGKGYATESSLALLEYGFNVLNLDEIIAIAEPEHKASIRVMEKVGMNFQKQAPYEEGGEDAVWYGLKKSAYKSR